MTQPTTPDDSSRGVPAATSPGITTPCHPDLAHTDPQGPVLQDAATADETAATTTTMHVQPSTSPLVEEKRHRQYPNPSADVPHDPRSDRHNIQNDAHASPEEPASIAPLHGERRHGAAPHDDHRRASAPSSVASSRRAARVLRRRSDAARVDYAVPDAYARLDELAAGSPVQNPDEQPMYRFRSLEDARHDERIADGDVEGIRDIQGPVAEKEEERPGQETIKVSRAATQIYTHCYLILFSLLGTLARLGVQALTDYRGAPVIFGVIWANFGGSLVMGFLAEDRMLFLYEWGTPAYDQEITRAKKRENGSASDSGEVVDLAAAKKAHASVKKTIPLYIGLATGFCGSFTSFSSFIRDVFLAMSYDLVSPDVAAAPAGRNGGYSFMAVLSVVITTVSLSLSGLFLGAHLAIALEPTVPSLPYRFTRKFLDRAAVPVGVGAWIAAVALAAVPPRDVWRGDALFALVLAPLGCLARFHLALRLNGRVTSFPLGTFVANVAGTAVLCTCWDLAHLPARGGTVGCQVLAGVQDGFCGCLTTVSTWVAELSALRRGHAYRYGFASVAASLAVAVAIMGGLRWSRGFDEPLC